MTHQLRSRIEEYTRLGAQMKELADYANKSNASPFDALGYETLAQQRHEMAGQDDFIEGIIGELNSKQALLDKAVEALGEAEQWADNSTERNMIAETLKEIKEAL